MIGIKTKLLNREARLPEQRTPGAAGFDIWGTSVAFITSSLISIKTGVAVEIPTGYEGQLRLRSSVAKQGLMLANGVGTIDADFRGEIEVLLRLPEAFGLEGLDLGRAIAQLVIHKLPVVAFIEVDSLSETVRGSKGFGSTNK